MWWNPFKMREEKFPSLQFMNTDRMRLLLTPPWNGRSMPLRYVQCPARKEGRGGEQVSFDPSINFLHERACFLIILKDPGPLKLQKIVAAFSCFYFDVACATKTPSYGTWALPNLPICRLRICDYRGRVATKFEVSIQTLLLFVLLMHRHQDRRGPVQFQNLWLAGMTKIT